MARPLFGKREIFIGRGATRGQGLCEIEIQDLRPPSPDYAARLRRPATSGRLAFTATLLSPCVVYDRYLCVRPFLEAEDIAAAAAQPGALKGFDRVRWYSRQMIISGWNAQAGLPKSDILAIAPGSAFLFEKAISPSEVEGEVATLAAVLSQAGYGVGERWAEGFGEIWFQDKFHWEYRYAN